MKQPQPRTTKEQEKDHHEEVLDRNHQIVRKIEHYQNSRWRRFKFWWRFKKLQWWCWLNRMPPPKKNTLNFIPKKK